MIDNKTHEVVLKRWIDEGIKEEHMKTLLELAYGMGLKEGKVLVVKNSIDFMNK